MGSCANGLFSSVAPARRSIFTRSSRRGEHRKVIRACGGEVIAGHSAHVLPGTVARGA